MKKEYIRPNIGFTAFKNRNNTNLELASYAIGIGTEKMDPQSFKVKQLPKE